MRYFLDNAYKRAVIGFKRAIKNRIGIVRSSGIDWLALSDEAVRLERVDFHAAMALHQANAKLDPEDPLKRFRYGLVLRRALDLHQALTHFEFAVRASPNCGPYWSALIEQALDLMPLGEAMAFIDSLPPPGDNARPEFSKGLLLHLFRVGAGDEAVKRAGHLFGRQCLSVRQVEEPLWKYGFDIIFEDSGFRIEYGTLFLGWPFLIDRLLAQIPYLSRIAKHPSVRGRLHFCVGDMPEGDEVQLCFSSDQPHHLVVPDSVFLSTGAYSHFLNTVVPGAPSWDNRSAKLYWRGSLTGQAETFEEIFQLPRIRLVQIALIDARIDACITDLSQFGPLLPELEIRCQEMKLLGARQPESDICNYKYQVDIDGNTNSWPGLWQKMISGSPVIKLTSQYRQWYYDRLKHDENLLLIDDLHTELAPALERLASDDSLARRLGQNAFTLMNSMTPQSEYRVFEAAVLKALKS